MLGREGLIVIDGSELSGANTSIPEDVIAKGMSPEQFFELAFSRLSEFFYGLEVPPSSPMLNFGFQDIYNFDQLLEQDPQRLLQDYINVVSERLKASPLVVTILDGSMIYKYLENEEDYASLVDELFEQLLDYYTEDLVKKTHMTAAILFFGFKIHISRSFADSPMIDALMKKYGVDEGDEKLDKQQFSDLLKLILRDIADDLALNHVTVESTFTLSNGGITKQLLEEEMILDVLRNVLYQQSIDSQEDESFADVFKSFIASDAATYGIPPYDADDESIVHLYDSVFSDKDFQKRAIDLNKDEVGDLTKKVLEKFAQELEANPLFY